MLRYDFHGVGYYDYVAPCDNDDYSIATGLPIRVTVRQDQCSSTRATPTCVRQVFITVVDNGVSNTIWFLNVAGTCMSFA